MSKRLENLNSIVAILGGGAKAYRTAARAVQNSALEEIFLKHADLREHVARDLGKLIDEAGAEPADPATREVAAGVMGKVTALLMAEDPAARHVAHLEEHEDRTLEAFRFALNHPDNARDDAMLREYFARFEETHQTMRTIKHAEDTKEAAEAQA